MVAKNYNITVKCHVATGFTEHLVKVTVDIPTDSYSDAKAWAKANGERLCKQYAEPGDWYDGIYNISRQW